jgi:hypothetical protein
LEEHHLSRAPSLPGVQLPTLGLRRRADMLAPLSRTHRRSADAMRALLAHARATPALFRQALTSVPPRERDAWLDHVFGLDALPADGPAMPRGCVPFGSVFFLYCPFGGERLEGVIDGLEPIAQTRAIRVCSVDLPLPRRPWLEASSAGSGGLAVYRSTLLDGER